MGALEVVVGDAGGEVVDVVQADIAGEELQHLRQLQVRAALQRRLVVAPRTRSSPSRRPRTGAGRRRARSRPTPPASRTALTSRKSPSPATSTATRSQSPVRDRCAKRCVGSAAVAVRDEPRRQHHRDRSARARTSPPGCGTAGSPAAAPRSATVFGDGERQHVPDAAPVEVAGSRVMDGVVVAPADKRREHQQPTDGAEPLVGPWTAGTMP